MSCESNDAFSARYPPHSDSIVLRSRRQILSVRRKYYAGDLVWVASEGFDSFSAPYTPYSDFSERSRRKYSPFGENTTLQTLLECPVRVLIRSPLDTLHTPIVSDPDAKYSPFGENTTLQTKWECPVRVFICSLLDTLHTPIVRSRRLILSIRRKYYALNCMRVPFEGFDAFTTRYSPQFDNVISRTRL